mgnify:FL=1
MGNTERQSERSTEVFGDLLYSARDSKDRAIKSLGIAALASLFAFRKGHRALPITVASVFGATALVNHLESKEKQKASRSLKTPVSHSEKPQLEIPLSHEQVSDEFTLETSEEFITDIISSIEHAKDRVWLEFRQFESGQVMSTLVEALIRAKERGVDVNFHLDSYAKYFTRVGNRDVWRYSQILRNPKEPETGLDERVLKQKNRFLTEFDIEKLLAAGIVVFSKATGRQKYIPFSGGGNHRKYVIVDETAWLGTTELTDSDISGMDNFMLKTQSVRFVSILGDIFTNPPQQDATYRSSKEQETDRIDWELLVDSGKPHSSIIYKRALEMIENAQEKIEFVTQYWPEGDLEQVLIEKAKAGVDVRIIMQSIGDHRIWRLPFLLRFLQFITQQPKGSNSLGMRVELPSNPTHAKGLVVDGKSALFGSNNLFEPTLITGVKEISIFTENPELVTQIEERIFNHTK